MKTIKSIEEFNRIIAGNKAAGIYFSHDACSVCKVLKPKIAEMLTEEFPGVEFLYVDVNETPDISAQNSIFTVPTVIFYFEGKEYIRKSRNISVPVLAEELTRPYEMIFG